MSYLELLHKRVDTLSLNEESRALIKTLIQQRRSPNRWRVEEVLRIWEISPEQSKKLPGVESTVIWIEEGNDKAGLKHIVERHSEEFDYRGIPEDKIAELVEAATTLGTLAGRQGKEDRRPPPRPILVLYFYGKPFAVAISVGSNGFVVGMNPRNFEQAAAAAGLDKTQVKEVSSWPKVVV